MEQNEITYATALDLYLKGDWDLVMPFDHSIEKTFIRYLEELGVKVVDKEVK